MNNIGIIIPTYNEEENIGKLVESIKSFVPNSEIFVVDERLRECGGILNVLEDKVDGFHLI